MSFVGEATGVFGLLGKAGNLLRDRLDPARAQAKRLIETFEAYGIARQQIPRLLPPELKLPNAAFSTPDKLKDKLTSELLDWAADHLAINRAWLDGVSPQPHLRVDKYKQPTLYRDWLLERQQIASDARCLLLVWKPEGVAVGPNAHGPMCLVYEEISDGLDGTELSRYWLLSEGWHWDHSPCVSNMVAAVAVAQSLGVMVIGHDLPSALLEQLEAGKKLAPVVAKQRQHLWHPGDLITPLPRTDTPWRRAMWKDAQDWLGEDGLHALANGSAGKTNSSMAAPAASRVMPS
ncbi:MAG: hypothetical protein Q8Q84_10295 [Hydrogenophaga sp.]|nr:hypothetical protein [Hydrogenophaga sp.]